MSSAPDPAPPRDPSSRLAAVPADMAGVFAEAGAPAEPLAPSLRRPAAVSALRPGTKGGRGVAVIAAAAAGLAGLGAGAFAMRQPILRPAPPAAAPPVQPVVVAATAAPALPPASPSPARAPVLAAADPAPAAPVAAAPAARKAAPARAARPRKAKVSRASVRAAAATPPDCVEDPAADDCRDAVMRADRRLRQAYARAAREGVPPPVLVDYHERWVDLREAEAQRPRRLIREYRALAAELGREPREPPEERERLRLVSPLRELKTALLSWW